jgi:hypothetical protein
MGGGIQGFEAGEVENHPLFNAVHIISDEAGMRSLSAPPSRGFFMAVRLEAALNSAVRTPRYRKPLRINRRQRGRPRRRELENQPHWHMPVIFREGKYRLKTGDIPSNSSNLAVHERPNF